VGQRVKCKACGELFEYSNHRPSEPNCSRLFNHQPDCILKDNDIKGQNKLCFRRAVAKNLIEKLTIDAMFLSDTYQTMDYSLLGKFFE
jgi:hypothetical protein